MAAADAEELQAPTALRSQPRLNRGGSPSSARPKLQPRRRRRVVISCTECHRRKQKCDRKSPCTNCVSRNKQQACEYDTSAPAMRRQEARGPRDGESASPDTMLVGGSLPVTVADFGYSQTGVSTLGFLRKIEGMSPSELLSGHSQDTGYGDPTTMRERYKSLVRQLPAKTYIDKLVDIYYTEISWQYFVLDRDVFDRQLEEWHNVPFGLLTKAGPQALSPDLRVFPALLFQVLSTALLVLPPVSESEPEAAFFDPLKCFRDMTFEDLAVDYSESGVAILSLLGKRQMSMTTVLAGFLRASVLKMVGLVTESWHAIGTAIRDGQEIGLHRDSLDPKPASDDAEAVLENQWEIQRRRKLWMTLVAWDIHTGGVLGRPTAIDPSSAPFTLPIDAPTPISKSRTPVTPRGEDDPPTPLTKAIWQYCAMTETLRSILALEKEGPCPKDFSKVDKVHGRLLELENETPPYLRRENPDERFDSLPECHWLPYVRVSLPSMMSFNVMALHRPYVFTRQKSRTEALKASLDMLHSQRLHFQQLKPKHYKTFSLFFGTFDAIILVATVYILFPKEHPELVDTATQHFHWAVERFEAMSAHNALARAAMGVLRAIHLRMRRSLAAGFDAAASSSPGTASNPTPDSNSNGGCGGYGATSTPGSDLLFGGVGGGGGGEQVDWAQPGLPSGFDWAAIQPIFAMGDIIYNDLVGVPGSADLSQWEAPQPPAGSWQFNGGFGDDSVWNLLNQYNPC